MMEIPSPIEGVKGTQEESRDRTYLCFVLRNSVRACTLVQGRGVRGCQMVRWVSSGYRLVVRSQIVVRMN